jgi:transcription elongation factor GreB
MGRVRPDKPKPMRPSYITAEGQARLRAEVDHLWRIKRPEVTRAVSEAAALGDRSENAEYIYGKKMLREIDRRVRFLRRRLDVLKVVDQLPDDRSRVFFGAWVRIESVPGRPRTLRIVGPDETDHAPRYVSVESPMAKALIGRREGDEVVVSTPHGRTRWTVVAVSYDPLATDDGE